jgi:tripeptide aminopeptidase
MRPPGEIPANHPLVRLAETSLREEAVVPHLEIASTDANVPLSRGLPAICMGLTSGGNAHTTAEYLDIDPVHRGMNALLRIVIGAYLLN